MRIIENFTAATPKGFDIAGDYFYLDTVPGGTVSVSFFRDRQKLAEDLTSVVAGWYAAPSGGFDRVELTSTLTQAVSFYLSRGRVGSNVFSGAVSVTAFSNNGSHVPAAKTVTNASAQLLAANSARKYLLIQNQDATGIIFVRGDGAAATATSACIRIGPGDVWEPSVAPVGELRAIGDIASNANIHTIEA